MIVVIKTLNLMLVLDKKLGSSVIKINPLENMNACTNMHACQPIESLLRYMQCQMGATVITKFNGNPSDNC